MDAIGYEVASGMRIDLIFRCRTCGTVNRNKAIQHGCDPDDFERILKLTAKGLLR